MKRPTIVYIGTALLVFVTARLAWTASQLEPNPKYLIGNWHVVGVSALITALFYYKPLIMRWLVAPYFFIAALSAFGQLSKSGVSVASLLGLGLSALFAYVGYGLVILKKEPIQPPVPTRGNGP
jgi:hypothetical protein